MSCYAKNLPQMLEKKLFIMPPFIILVTHLKSNNKVLPEG